jgi:hypothetical protein
MPPRLFIPYVQELMRSPWHKFDDELIISNQVNDGTSNYWHYREIVSKTKKKFGVSTRAAEVQMQKYGLVASPKDAEVGEARRRLKMYRSLWA